MLPPKAFLDALTDQASRLLGGDALPPRQEFENQFRTLLQGAFSRLDLVSREEFDTQMAVLARTRAKVDALEARLGELEARLASGEVLPAAPDQA
ncbi:accessory factor UbiK family protein [Pseudomonas sp. DC3000-4b1]|uniref:accessory factor UbiK family protein n=1 Tax=unclassified Pseudomonas TaxID=196821 RepID=UPI003CFB52B5